MTLRNHTIHGLLTVLLVCLRASIASAQQPATQPAAMAPETQPADVSAALATGTLPAGAEQIQARVIEVKGRAQHAPLGTAVTETAAWKPVAVGDTYPAGTLVRTSLGSHVILQFGAEEPYTVVMVERMTLANLSSLYKTATDKVSRVAVNYGAVRGGVSEGGLRSSFVVDSTVATLTKRGTWGFRLFVERGTGRYEVSLAETGLVEVLNNLTREQQNLRRGQYVTETMRRWVEQARFDRLITLQDRYGITRDELQAQALQGGGLSVLNAAPSAVVWQFARPGEQQFVTEQLQILQGQQAPSAPRPGVVDRPEGDFNSRFR